MTVKERIKIANQFIDVNYIIDEDMRQDIYLRALETEVGEVEFGTGKKILWSEFLATVGKQLLHSELKCMIMRFLDEFDCSCAEPCKECKKFKKNRIMKGELKLSAEKN